ncbi:MAG: branched-chain amino acid aminotransferase [Alphaproteobacteria bacterium]|nr:branched-chain amino acid aminotransferase [Alphaproteobacteria bacterium]
MVVGWKGWSKTWTFFEDDWHEGNVAILGPRSHASWLASTVFDGARAFEGVTPDLDLHLARVNRSAEAMYLKPVVSADMWGGLAREGLKRFDRDAALYIKPMYWSERTGVATVAPDPDSTSWCLTLYELPMPGEEGQSICLSPFRRPTPETMPVEAKAACLYPNNARAVLEAKRRGFDNALVCDLLGNVAETANSNVFMAKDGAVFTPAPNGTFLDGVTRQRIIKLLRQDGIEVIESALKFADFERADEIFTSGNYAKLGPVIRIGERSLQPGPIYRRARKLYWEFAHG